MAIVVHKSLRPAAVAADRHNSVSVNHLRRSSVSSIRRVQQTAQASSSLFSIGLSKDAAPQKTIEAFSGLLSRSEMSFG